MGRMCQALEVSRAGYYAWRDRPVSDRELESRVLALHIKAIHRITDGTYGSPRIAEELKESGVRCSENRIARIKQKMGLRAIASPRRFRCTTQAASDGSVAPDRVERDFGASEPNQKWVSDITYIPIARGHAYLCCVMDLFSRKIVGWTLRSTLSADLVRGALRRACSTRAASEGLIFHSDRGSPYTSDVIQRTLAENGILSSMGRKGDCFDNATAESFFSTLKTERVNRDSYATIDQARRRIGRYISFYNQHRRHYTLGQRSPDIYEQLMAA